MEYCLVFGDFSYFAVEKCICGLASPKHESFHRGIQSSSIYSEQKSLCSSKTGLNVGSSKTHLLFIQNEFEHAQQTPSPFCSYGSYDGDVWIPTGARLSLLLPGRHAPLSMSALPHDHIVNSLRRLHGPFELATKKHPWEGIEPWDFF